MKNRTALPLFVLLSALTVSNNVHSSDLDRADPQRRLLLDRLRESSGDVYKLARFDVKRIWSTRTTAYLCAMPVTKDGVHVKPDSDHFELLEAYATVRYDHWNVDYLKQHYVSSLTENPCKFKPADAISEELIREVIKIEWSRAGKKPVR